MCLVHEGSISAKVVWGGVRVENEVGFASGDDRIEGGVAEGQKRRLGRIDYPWILDMRRGEIAGGEVHGGGCAGCGISALLVQSQAYQVFH